MPLRPCTAQDTAGLSKHFYHSVRFKLLLVSLTLLGIPWAGYQFILETEHFLQQAQNQNLHNTAQALANVLAQQEAHFSGYRLPGQSHSAQNFLLHPWHSAPVIDGYQDDWEQYKHQFTAYELPDQSLSAQLVLGQHHSQAYLLLSVKDASHSYGEQGDWVDISTGGVAKSLVRFRIQPSSPGWVVAKRLRRQGSKTQAAEIDGRIRGEWQETPLGYTLELRLPRTLLGERLAIAIRNSADGSQLQSSRLFPLEELGQMIEPSEKLQTLLNGMAPSSARVWAVDHEGLVLAQYGQLDANAPLSADEDELPWIVQQLILAVLPQQADATFSLPVDSTRLLQTPIDTALAGRPASLRRRIPDSDSIVVSAAAPIHTSKGVSGAVLVEQTTNAILSIQNLALQRLFAVTLIFFVVTSLGLLLFATLLTSRIRRLHHQFDLAVSHDGRITGEIKAEKSRDEIGELSRGLAAVLSRLSDYNHYLEAMASRLAHELRTPLSVVRTSLDNAAQTEDSVAQSDYLARAHGGAERLELILKQLREATRLEQTLQDIELVNFDILELLKHQTEAFHDIWPTLNIALSCKAHTPIMHGAPELICQALEKLMANAVDFHADGSRIEIRLQMKPGSIDLSVDNHGPVLPKDIDLFKSMVSGRTERSDEPHLGLGLYLVRLIAEFHRGQAFAKNLAADTGVSIGMRLPLQ